MTELEYEKTYDTPKCHAENLMLFHYLDKLKKDCNILELGSGFGDPFTKYMRSNITDYVVGLDIDEEMLEANPWLTERILNSYTKFTFLDSNFFAVVNFFGVYGSHFDVSKMFENSFNVLEKDGDLMIVAFAAGRKDTPFGSKFLHKWGKYREWTVNQLRILADYHGYEIVECFGFSPTWLHFAQWLPFSWFRALHKMFRNNVNIPIIRDQYIFLWAKKK